MMKEYATLTPAAALIPWSLVAAILLVTPAGADPSTAGCSPGKDGTDAALTGIVNSYYPATADAAAGATSILLGTLNLDGSPTTLAPGDQVLIIQMQDADVDASNTADYGDGPGGDLGRGITAANSTGLFELACVESVDATSMTLTAPLENSYHAGGGSTFQVVRVPQYADPVALGGSLTAAPWDGRSGGIVVIDVAGTFDFDGWEINVSGLGFRGGLVSGTGGGSDNTIDYATSSTVAGGAKGEGIAGTPGPGFGYPDPDGDGPDDFARGAPGNAGGGGNAMTGGGGGGANCGGGGPGQPDPQNGANGGLGGAGFSPGPIRLILGGAGGSGEPAMAGGDGGGMVMLYATTVEGSGGTVHADGLAGADGQSANAGGGGGGGGGSVLISAQSTDPAGNLTVTADGGQGGNARGLEGYGGGGGGGVIITSWPPDPSYSVAGGGSLWEFGSGDDGDVGTFLQPPSCGPPPPGFHKTFEPDTIPLDGTTTSTLTFTISGPQTMTNLAFTDDLPAGMEIAAPPNDCCGGTLTAGDTWIKLESGTASSCTCTVDVLGTQPGTWFNVTSPLTFDGGLVGPADARLTVTVPPPGFSKTFTPDRISLDELSRLSFTINNAANLAPLNDLAFADPLPDGMVIATPANPANTCGGTLSAADGGAVIALSGGTVPAGGICTIAVDVGATKVQTYQNRTSALEFDGGSSAAADASLQVKKPRLGVSVQPKYMRTPPPQPPDDTARFKVELYNEGPDPMTDKVVHVKITEPPGQDPVRIPRFIPDQGTTYQPITNFEGTWTVHDLPVEVTAALEIEIDVTDRARPGKLTTYVKLGGWPLDATASLTITEGGPNGGQNLKPDPPPTRTGRGMARNVELPTGGQGTEVSYLWEVSNTGLAAATGVKVDATIDWEPGGVAWAATVPYYESTASFVWDVGKLAVDDVKTKKITAFLGLTILDPSKIRLSARFIAMDQLDLDASNDNAEITTQIGSEPLVFSPPCDTDVQVAVVASPSTVDLNDLPAAVTWTVTATNVGPGDATAVVVKVLPILIGVSHSADPGTSFDSTTGDWTMELPAHARRELVLELVVDSAATNPDEVRAVLAAIDQTDCQAANDEDSASTLLYSGTPINVDVGVVASDQVVEVVQPVVEVGRVPEPEPLPEVSHTVTTTNKGSAPATNVVVTEDLVIPEGISLYSVSADAGIFEILPGPKIRWRIATLPQGTAVMELVYRVGLTVPEGSSFSTLAKAGTAWGYASTSIGDVIFRDGFETGDTSRWSDQVP